jgi:hypothetical protein
MMKTLLACIIPLLLGTISAAAREALESDAFDTAGDELKITFIGQSLR